jgi:integrase
VKALHSAKRTVFTTVRKAKSVFTKKMLQRYLDAAMQIDVVDFLARSVENGPSIRYKAPKDQSLAPRTFQASKKLREDDPQAFICFLLAMQAGLRKSEIANAKVFWLEDQLIHVQPDGEYDTKNSHEREVPINADTYRILLEVIGERGCDGYILTGHLTERTDNVFRRLNKWLADLGWTHSDKRIHELRKWYGSQVARIGGLHAAQHLLGHMDYSTTDRYYADPGAKVVVNE